MEHRVISHEELADRWHEIKDYVNESLVHGLGDVSAHDLFIECLQNICQCWLVEEEDELIGVAITRILRYKKYSELVIVTTTTNKWFEVGPTVLEDIEQFARDMDCKYTSLYGRKGWVRALKKYGYEQPYTILMKEV